jgi:hypothetical protein
VTPGFVPADLAPTRNFVLTATGTEGVGDAACGATPVMKGSRPRGAARLALSRIGESRRADRGYSSVTTYPPEGRLREGMGKPWSANSLAAATAAALRTVASLTARCGFEVQPVMMSPTATTETHGEAVVAGSWVPGTLWT